MTSSSPRDAAGPDFAGVVTVEEATPEQAREMCLREIEAAKNADSLDHMLAHMQSAVIWAKGAKWHEYNSQVQP